MTKVAKGLAVGDKVIYVSKYGARPQEDEVIKVTKSGQIRTNLTDGGRGGNLKETWTGSGRYVPLKSVSRRWSCAVYPYSKQKWDELDCVAAQHETEQREKELEQARKREEREERLEQERGEVLAAIKASNTNSTNLWDTMETFPDGSRLYRTNLPVKPELAERKQFEVVFVRCRQASPSWGEDAEKTVESHVTYINGNSHSFPSCSGQRFASDEQALIEAYRSVYHSW